MIGREREKPHNDGFQKSHASNNVFDLQGY